MLYSENTDPKINPHSVDAKNANDWLIAKISKMQSLCSDQKIAKGW